MAHISLKNDLDTIDFIRLTQIDVDNLRFILSTISKNPQSRMPHGIPANAKFIARQILIAKCLSETLEKYFKTILLATNAANYNKIGNFRHNLRGLYRKLPRVITFPKGYRIRIKNELHNAGIGTGRKERDFLDVNYTQLRYEGTPNPAMPAKLYSVKLSMAKLWVLSEKIDRNLFNIAQPYARHVKKNAPSSISPSTIRQHKALNTVQIYGNYESMFAALAEHDEFEIKAKNI